DKWLVSCLGVLYLSKGLFYRVVPADQSFSSPDQYAGVFRFRLWWCGEWVEVLVDDRLPTVNGKLAFLQSVHSDQFWPGLLEKAYAKLHGSYEALKYGTMLDGLADLTGGITESISIRQDPTSSGRLLNKLLDMTSLITCTVQSSQPQPTRPNSEKLANGIQIGINYRLYALERIETYDGEPVQLVKLRNPLGGGGEYIGAWSRDSSNWDAVSAHDKETLGVRHLADGEFWISYADFLKAFTHLEVVHLDSETSRDEPSLHHKNTWQMRLFQGTWQRGVTAGGCRNNPETFHINPQLHLILSELEEVIISLNQHSIMEPKVIGFTGYSLPKSSSENTGRAFFKKNKSLVNSQYTNSRQVSHRCQLEQGSYLVLPTTFEPGQESGFTLRVYSSNPLKLKLLDSLPSVLKSAIVKAPSSLDTKSFSQYEAVFLQLADEHRTVNAFELQELLDACLPNDYIKSCACMEVLTRPNSEKLANGIQIGINYRLYALERIETYDGEPVQLVKLRNPLGGGGEYIGAWSRDSSNWDAVSAHDKETLGVRHLADGEFWISYADFLKAFTHLEVVHLDSETSRDEPSLHHKNTWQMRLFQGTWQRGVTAGGCRNNPETKRNSGVFRFNIYEAKDPLQNGTIKMTLSEWLKSSLAC
ncbi:calpain-C-like, partial [Diaphorina citri]|uniref:Calpain-C-like n=1 Tax=Diaphorina citri TaxID=121845 RepID=A0A1S3DR66_DIACI